MSPLSPEQEARCREAFEATAKDAGFTYDFTPNPTPRPYYLSNETQLAWYWWQTAWSAAEAGQHEQLDDCPDCGAAMIEVCSGLEINARGEYAGRCIEPQWECFCDESYYHQWAVREIGEKRWGHSFHVPSKEEAEGLRDLLNTRPKRESVTQAGQWLPIETAPRCVPSDGPDNGLRPVIVTRHPVKGRYYPMAIARLTSAGWIAGTTGTPLWFEPTHWTDLPVPPSGISGLQPKLTPPEQPTPGEAA